VDLSGKFTPGINQEQKQCKYLLVGVYTFPITRDGEPLASPDGVEPQDQPLPGLDEFSGEDEAEEGQDLLQEQDDGNVDVEGQGENEDQKADTTAHGCLLAWQKLVEESMNVTVKNIIFVETIESRHSQHVLPAIAKIYSRLRQLGLPVMRLHSDRAREFIAAPLRRWAQHRDIVLTKTAGDDYKANGRCEAELGVTKRAIRTVISAGKYSINLWPLVAKHVGERRLRAQLRACGYAAGDLLKFGTQAFALRKWWQSRYDEWRDIREPVLVLGPDACISYSPLTRAGTSSRPMSSPLTLRRRRVLFLDKMMISLLMKVLLRDHQGMTMPSTCLNVMRFLALLAWIFNQHDG